MAACAKIVPGLLPLLLLAAAAQAQSLTGSLLSDFNALANQAGTIMGGDVSHSGIFLYSPSAFCAAADITGNCFVAATRFGGGRLVQFGHESDLSRWNEMGKLLQNAAGWASKGAKTVHVGYTEDLGQKFVDVLVQQTGSGYKNAGQVTLSNLLFPKLRLLVLNGQEACVGDNAESIRSFIKAGGGVILASQVWYWSYTNPVVKHPNNLLTSTMGIIMGTDIVQSDYTLVVGSPPVQSSNANVGLKCLADSCLGKKGCPCCTSDSAKLAELMQRVVKLTEFAPTNSTFLATLASYAKTYAKTGLDWTKPIALTSAGALGVIARTALYKYLPPNELPVAPEAKFFPGLPPAGTKPLGPTAAKITGTTATKFWQCLGLYAMPGKPVTVTIPDALLDLPADSKPITLHIGGWTDEIYRERTVFQRPPEIVRFYTVSGTSTVIGSAFGGLIYITLPEGLTLGDQVVTVTGAIKAAIMTEGMSAAQWAATLVASPAPWGEVSTSKLVISTPRTALAKVTDPGKVTTYWNKVLDSHAWLAGIPANRPNPERIQHDVDISVGYMHSGYPIMTFLDVIDATLDPGVARGGHWGLFHELGHNHQQPEWTWECTGEVTCNLFSVRAQYAVRGTTDAYDFYGWYADNPEGRQTDRDNFFSSGADYRKLCESPGLYLDSFLQVMEDGGYGFELLRDTIASYKQLETKPETNEDKIQTWVILQSKVVGCNFYPFYLKWGWPVTKATDKALADLPVWPNCKK